jgi:hypothetical protein
MVSSVEMPSTSLRWNATRQSPNAGLATATGLVLTLPMFSNDVEPAAEQTFLPPRSLMLFAFEALATSTFCPAS